ncbi:MAG: 2-phospho-L-lactate guanylyltransferase [Herpetosiphonaceae bacterium]|nr:2-phospho-L-lactate guanylyltransferase [Herpetosiphonaceae bacterium]
MLTQPPVSIIAVLPIRSLHDGKQRLAGVLALEQREQLVRQLAQGVMGALRQAHVIETCVVVSGDNAVLEWAERQGSATLYEATPGLNPALEAARQWATVKRADGLLIILPDLPLLTAADVLQLVAQSTPHSVILAPDRHGTGTNALLLRPLDLLPFRFGVNSLQQHQLLAQRAGVDLTLCSLPGFALDLDTPADLVALGRTNPAHPLAL